MIDRYCKQFGKVRQLVGIHAGEQRRLLQKDGSAHVLEDKWKVMEYPLILWGLEQHHCNALCLYGIGEIPPKSSCWFCPNKPLSAVRKLKEEHPDYYQLGCFIEEQDELRAQERGIAKKVKGLGRQFSWRDIDRLTPLEQLAIDARKEHQSCRCMD
ncbi:hypothetical protein [Roseofilum casamattae]|uniref:Phosphoadenosine phosphosulphate reductase domain-containing protein n=1 Tax=Roseofilum casamattae BLCC-M143 TaxID=3022442 RepID=A0ABT7C3W2_9CYAN|nr:hypothetical protein [Roseofilum casamattae]MDJ1185887.1 hypothetical protein [Roseofilum casamattae BLCC-M143]